MTPNSSICLDIPTTCDGQTFVWPPFLESNKSCPCRISGSQDGIAVLNRCACIATDDPVRVPYVNPKRNQICLNDHKGNLNGIVVVAGCFSQDCGDNCFLHYLQTIHKIVVSGIIACCYFHNYYCMYA